MALDVKSPRQLRTEQVKEKIMMSMIDIIRKHGVEYVTVANICKAAGVSVGSFYHHFGSKDELLAHYLIDAFDRRADEFQRIDSGDVVEDLLEYYRLYNAFLLDQGFAFIRNFYTNTNKGLYSRRSYLLGTKSYVPLTRTVHQILLAGQERGQLVPDCDMEQLVYDMSVLEKGVLFDWCLCEGEYDLQVEVARLLRNYLHRFVK